MIRRPPSVGWERPRSAERRVGSSFADALKAVVRQLRHESHPLQRVRTAWQQAAGDRYAGHTEVQQFQHGVLTVTVDDASIRSELVAFEQFEILEKVQSGDGADVAEIRFRLAHRREE